MQIFDLIHKNTHYKKRRNHHLFVNNHKKMKANNIKLYKNYKSKNRFSEINKKNKEIS